MPILPAAAAGAPAIAAQKQVTRRERTSGGHAKLGVMCDNVLYLIRESLPRTRARALKNRCRRFSSSPIRMS